MSNLVNHVVLILLLCVVRKSSAVCPGTTVSLSSNAGSQLSAQCNTSNDICLQGGTYTGFGASGYDCTNSANVAFWGVGLDVTILDGELAGPIFSTALTHTTAIVFRDLTLTRGVQASTRGGCIRSSRPIELYNVKVSACSALGGGGVYVESVTSVILSSVLITLNSATNAGGGGGGASFFKVQSLQIIDSTFHQNSAVGDGGGLLVSHDTNTVLSSVALSGTNVFSFNSGNYGGAIRLRIGRYSFVNAGALNVTNNVAPNWGGGIDVYASDTATPSTVDLGTGATIQDNASKRGGGLCVFVSTAKVDISGTSVLFEDNSATPNSGGGIYYWGVGTLTFVSSTFRRNTTPDAGGGLALRSSPNLSAMLFLTSCLFESNRAAYGGGLNLLSESDSDLRAYVTDVATFISNTASTQGGGVFLHSTSSNARPILNGPSAPTSTGARLILTNNVATSQGGGFFGAKSNLTFSGSSEFTGNSGSQGGGLFLSTSAAGVFVSDPNSVPAPTCVFQLNSATGATNGGGAIAVSGSTTTLTATSVALTFCRNSAANMGGALYMISGIANFGPGTSFSDNTASSYGGSIFTAGPASLSLVGSQISPIVVEGSTTTCESVWCHTCRWSNSR